jgi:hypothetical protein
MTNHRGAKRQLQIDGRRKRRKWGNIEELNKGIEGRRSGNEGDVGRRKEAKVECNGKIGRGIIHYIIVTICTNEYIT